ncbi:unnamed protein product, partial [Prorocentrum cordatum]
SRWWRAARSRGERWRPGPRGRGSSSRGRRRPRRSRSRSWENRPRPAEPSVRGGGAQSPPRASAEGKRPAAPSRVAAGRGTEEERREKLSAEREADEAMRRLQSKYARDEGAPAAAKAADEALAAEREKEDDDPEDANALGALALEAMLAGDMARYDQLNKRLEERQAALAAAGPAATGTADGVPELPPSKPQANVKILEEVDSAGRKRSLVESVQSGPSVRTQGRNKRGTANAVPSGKKNEKQAPGYYEDDNVSLDDLLKRERITGVQDYDHNLSSHILKKGSKFKMLEEDEDEAYALGWYESK